MKLYIAGPMSGYIDHNKPAFFRAAADTRSLGHQVSNPAENDDEADGKSWEDYLRKDMRLLSNCDGIVLLPGWTESRGARLEAYIAFKLGMKFFFYVSPRGPKDTARIEPALLEFDDPSFRSLDFSDQITFEERAHGKL